MEQKEKLNQSKLKNMGFSDRLIKLLLPEPELVNNPHGRSKIKLWCRSDVEKAMRAYEFMEYQEKKRKRSEAADKAVKTKKENLLVKAEESVSAITVRKIPYERLKREVLTERKNFYERKGSYEEAISVFDANESTVRRWIVNYVRHDLTDYDRNLYEIAKKTGKHKAYLIIFKGIMLKISEVYPELLDECQEQINLKEQIASWL